MSLWTAATLCTDADLTAYETRQPDAAKKVRGDSGDSAYDGKRALAKEEIASRLETRGINPDGLLRPAQLKRVAVFFELSLIFRDLAQRNDTVTAEKSAYYEGRAIEELDRISAQGLEYEKPTTTPVATVRMSVWMRRS